MHVNYLWSTEWEYTKCFSQLPPPPPAQELKGRVYL